MPAGRPTKLTPELQDQILSYLRTGNYLDTACAAVGIARFTLHRWLKRGARAKRGVYREFCDAVEKARAEAEISGLGLITRAAMPQKVLDAMTPAEVAALSDESRRRLARLTTAGDWTAMAWRLERTMPAKFTRRVEVVGKDGEALVPPGRLGPEEIAAAVAGVLSGVRKRAGAEDQRG